MKKLVLENMIKETENMSIDEMWNVYDEAYDMNECIYHSGIKEGHIDSDIWEVEESNNVTLERFRYYIESKTYED